MIRLLIAATCCLAIAIGCGFPGCQRAAAAEPAPAEQPADVQARLANAAEAAVGCDALAAGAPVEVAAGVRGYALATAGKASLPAPSWSVPAIAADPTGYRKAGEKAQRVANGTQVAFMLKAVAGVLGALAVAFAGRAGFLPAPWGQAIGLVWSFLAPKADRKTDEAAHDLLAGVRGVFARADTLPPEQRQALDALLAGLPAKAREALVVVQQVAAAPPAKAQA